MSDLPEFENDENFDQLVSDFTESTGGSRGRAPITPEFEEPSDPITADMVGSQAWANERLAHQAFDEQAGSGLLREMWIAFKHIAIAVLAALLVATIFSYWTPDESLSEEFRQQLRFVDATPSGGLVLASTPLPTAEVQRTVGIIAGHSGPPQDDSFTIDPGAVCDDNSDNIPELTELEINTNVARLVVEKLLARGYEVELLNEFDDRLANYRADALLSIHTNDCQNYGFGGTGFNAAGPSSRVLRGADEALVRCVINNYESVTGLNRHFGVTEDMTSYHTFNEVSVDTPVAIIEIGFMFADRQFLVNDQETIAEGITQGLMCFLEPDEFYNASDVETGQ